MVSVCFIRKEELKRTLSGSQTHYNQVHPSFHPSSFPPSLLHTSTHPIDPGQELEGHKHGRHNRQRVQHLVRALVLFR